MRSHAAWRSFFSKKSAPVQRGARFAFPDLGAVGSWRDSAGLPRKRSHAARRSFFGSKSRSHAACRSKCLASLWHPRSPALRFPILWAPLFLSCCSFSALALCFSIIRGRPWPSVPSLEVLFFRFGAPALYLSIRGAVLFRSWASPWVAWGCLLGRRGRSGPDDAFPCSVALVFHPKGDP